MKNLLTIAVLSVLAVGSFFFLRSLQKELTPEVVEEKIQPIGTGMGVKTTVYNQSNQRVYELTSDKVIEFSAHHGTEFVQPFVLAWDDNSQLSWQGESKKAFLSGDKNLLTMTQSVEIIQTPSSIKPTYLNGDEISYRVKDSMLSSQLPVKIDDGVSQQTADTMKANIKAKHVLFDGNVKARYQTLPKGD